MMSVVTATTVEEPTSTTEQAEVSTADTGLPDLLAPVDLTDSSSADTLVDPSPSEPITADGSTALMTTMEGDSYGGDPYGGDPYGGDPYGGDPYGGDPYGGTAPTTTGISDVNVLEDADDEVISLYDAFDDDDDFDEDLDYQVVGNTNSSLFASVHTDGYGGLVLDFADDAYGSADLTVRATDTDQMWVETTFTVTVDPVNDAPVIHDFVGVDQGGGNWEFEGYVTDVDDVVEGMVVHLGGVLEPYYVNVAVQANGYFYVYQAFPGLESGYATAQTHDDEPADSNLALYYVTVV